MEKGPEINCRKSLYRPLERYRSKINKIENIAISGSDKRKIIYVKKMSDKTAHWYHSKAKAFSLYEERSEPVPLGVRLVFIYFIWILLLSPI